MDHRFQVSPANSCITKHNASICSTYLYFRKLVQAPISLTKKNVFINHVGCSLHGVTYNQSQYRYSLIPTRTSYSSMSKWIQRRGEIVQPKGRVPQGLLEVDNPSPKFTKKRPIIKPSPAGMPSMYDTYINNSSAVVSLLGLVNVYLELVIY